MTDEERKEIVRLRMENSKHAVEATEVLIERELWSSVVNRIVFYPNPNYHFNMSFFASDIFNFN